MFSTGMSRARGSACVLLAAIAGAAFAPAAQAKEPSTSLVCTKPSASTFTQVFNTAPWNDPGYYALAPAGDFEGNLADWDLWGAKVVAGNESYNIAGAKKYSLSLPAGSSTESAPMCIGFDYPWMRFFLRNTGSASATLKLEVRSVSANGTVTSPLVYNLSGTSSWQLSKKILLINNTLALFTSNALTPVSFKFTPSGGNWQIDDVYVDPYRSR